MIPIKTPTVKHLNLQK
jgi:hypothetical protein